MFLHSNTCTFFVEYQYSNEQSIIVVLNGIGTLSLIIWFINTLLFTKKLLFSENVVFLQ